MLDRVAAKLSHTITCPLHDCFTHTSGLAHAHSTNYTLAHTPQFIIWKTYRSCHNIIMQCGLTVKYIRRAVHIQSVFIKNVFSFRVLPLSYWKIQWTEHVVCTMLETVGTKWVVLDRQSAVGQPSFCVGYCVDRVGRLFRFPINCIVWLFLISLN